MSSTDQTVVLDVRDRPSAPKWLVLSIQHLFAMFGATVLVPLLVGLSPAVALVSSGLGTLTYILITRGRIPAYLGSSFAFIAPFISAKTLGGPEGALVGCFFAGLVYGVAALLIRGLGVKWLLRILPPVVVGPVIMVIGLGLAGVAVNMAMTGTGADGGGYNGTYFAVALVTLAVTISIAMYLNNFFSLIPVLFGIAAGYILSMILGIVDFTPLQNAKFFQVPDFIIPFVTYTPTINWTILLIIVPVAIVTISEHIGDQMVLSKVAGKNFLLHPGLDRSLWGDGVATMLAAVIGGPPNTTYGENIGVVAITRVFSVFVIGGAACLAVLFGFIGVISGFISTIPVPVMGGVSLLLFGIIASSGLRMMIDSRLDLGQKRNLIIPSVILTIGVGGAFIQVDANLQIAGMSLAAIIGVFLNLILPGRPDHVATETMFEALGNR